MRTRLAGLAAALVGVVGLALLLAESLRVLNGNLLGTGGLVLVIIGAALVLVTAVLVLTGLRRGDAVSPEGPTTVEPTEA